MTQLIDLTGQKIGRWTVLYQAKSRRSACGRLQVYWHCICECGTERDVSAASLLRKNRKCVSCGCYAKENSRKPNLFIEKDTYYEGYTNAGDLYLISKEDYESVQKHSWRKRQDGYFCTTFTKDDGTAYPVLLHRFIMQCKEDEVVDHIKSEDKFDNRRENLRVGAPINNRMNQRLSSNNTTSGVTGVCWSNKDQRWMAYIGVDWERINLGTYINKEDAIAARKAAEKRHYGEWSYDNSQKIAEQYAIDIY